ncbi:hypothetical protein U1Q18_035187, partial [Sarracenia purpurea var. burkii]
MALAEEEHMAAYGLGKDMVLLREGGRDLCIVRRERREKTWMPLDGRDRYQVVYSGGDVR